MKEYAVTVDITMSGTIYVKANSQEEAEAMAYGKAGYYTASGLRNFINVTREVIESEEVID